MKIFLASFSVCLIVAYLVLFHFGNILIENNWAVLLLAAIISLVLLILIYRQQREISTLEDELNEKLENHRVRLEALEKAKNNYDYDDEPQEDEKSA